MPPSRQPEQQFPVKLTQAQRKVVAQIAPGLADRLKLDEKPQRGVQPARHAGLDVPGKPAVAVEVERG
jgi:hypothetical protein